MEQGTVRLDDIRDGMNASQRTIKRVFDVVFALTGMIVLSPVYLLIYVILRVSGGSSVIFRQERIGYGGKPFQILKFRTMTVDSEEDGVPRLTEGESEHITLIGGFLREHHLDELPQLWNVLRGDMSFVGPRPERKFFIDRIMERDPNYEYIYMMHPGLTSDATIYNGYTNTIEKMLVRLRMDLDYLQRRSLWLDAKIILKTGCFIIIGKKF